MKRGGKSGVRNLNKSKREKAEKKARRKNNLKRDSLNMSMFILELAAAVIPSVIIYYMVNSELNNYRENWIVVLLIVLILYFVLYLIKYRPSVKLSVKSIWDNCVNPLKGFLVCGLGSILISLITNDINILVSIAVHFVVYILTAAFFCATIATATIVANLDNKWEKKGIQQVLRYMGLSIIGLISFGVIFVSLSYGTFQLLHWIVIIIN